MGRNRPGERRAWIEHQSGRPVRPNPGQAIGIGPSNSLTIGPMRAVAAIAAHLALRRDGQHIVSLDTVIETMRQLGWDTRSPCTETSSGTLPVNFVQR